MMPTKTEQNENNNNEAIQAALRKAEAVQLQMQLQLRFKKNMAFFKGASDKIYRMFVNYQPTRQKLVYDDRGFLNLMNIASKSPVYDGNPVDFIEKQVDDFCQMPKRLSVRYKDMEFQNEKHIFYGHYTHVYENIGLPLEEKNINTTYPIGLLVVVGVGMGYHIEELIKRVKCKHVFIYDHDKDSFYASLFTLDWADLGKKITSKNHTLNICVGEDPAIAMHKMQGMVSDIGAYNMVHNLLFAHTNSTNNDIFYQEYSRTFPEVIATLGYFDDELISFSHTINHMNQGTPLFRPQKNTGLPPVFLIGNGPSLDDDMIDFIKTNQEKAIIISCGSALNALYNTGITPDLHVEIERNLCIYELHKMTADQEYTKKVPLLGLNTIIPSLSELFKSVHVAIKPLDLGAHILKRFVDTKDFYLLAQCNPTVSNGAVAYALALGFKEMYLLGMDFGMANENSHHSKHSIYTDMETDNATEENGQVFKGDYRYEQQRFTVKGNFSDTVETNLILNLSRKGVQSALHKSSEVRCFNANNGAHIQGAEPLVITSSDFAKNKKIDRKGDLVDSLLKENFIRFEFPKIDEDEAQQGYLGDVKQLSDSLKLPEQCIDAEAFNRATDAIFAKLKAIETLHPVFCRLYTGSVQTLFTQLVSSLYRTHNKEEFRKYYGMGSNTYNQMLDEFAERLQNKVLEYDDTGLME